MKNKHTLLLPALSLLAFSASGPAQTMNPTDGGSTLPLPAAAARAITGPLSPDRPGQDAGFAAIDAITQPTGPLADPNLIDMPALDDDGVGILSTDDGMGGKTWRIRPIVSSGVVYDDNIFISNKDRKGDVIFNIAGGLALELGDYREMEDNYLLLEYIAAGYFFSKYTTQNSFGQNASLLGQYRFNQLAVQLESTYQYINGAQRQVGGFTTRNLLYNALRFIYDYSEKTSFDLEFNQQSNIYDSPYNSSYYYNLVGGFDYRVMPKLRLGLEGIVGFVTADNNPDQTYQIANARVKYDLTGKVALKATGGVQFTQYATGGEPMRVSPVFSVGGEYLPFTNTALSLVAYRNLQVSPSLSRQDYWATGVELGITQTIAQRVRLGVATGYENDTYVPNTVRTRANRVDNYYFIRPSISYSFLKYLTATAFYLHRFNDSTLERDTWYDNQVGFELSAAF
jgi:hypothetical protein